MTAADPREPTEFNLAMWERITSLGAVPVINDLRAPQACAVLHRQLIFLLGISDGWARSARAVTATGAVPLAAATDDGMFVDIDANGAARAVNLPDAANLRQGWNCVIRKSDAVGANTLTITPDAGDAITGPTVINAQYNAIMVVRTGAATWATIGITAPTAAGGGGHLYAYSAPPPDGVANTVESFVFGSVDPNGAPAIGVDWIANPQPQVLPNPIVNPQGLLLMGPAPDAGDVFVTGPEIQNPQFVAGGFPNCYNIQYDLVGAVNTVFQFTWKGQVGYVFVNPAVL